MGSVEFARASSMPFLSINTGAAPVNKDAIYIQPLGAKQPSAA